MPKDRRALTHKLTAALLPTGKVNLKYELAVTAKSNNSAAIGCVVEFPSEINIRYTSSNSVLPLVGDKGAPVFVTLIPSNLSVLNNSLDSVELFDRHYVPRQDALLDKVATPEK